MTDINRLIASLKRRSAHVKEFGDDVTFVKLKDIDALVEALEKAKQLATQQGNIACALSMKLPLCASASPSWKKQSNNSVPLT